MMISIKRMVGVVECGIPKVKISVDEDCSKSVLLIIPSLAALLKIGMHDSIEKLRG